MVYDGVKRTAYYKFRLLGQRLGLGRPVMKSCFNANEKGTGDGGQSQLHTGEWDGTLDILGWRITYIPLDVEVLDKRNAMKVFLGNVILLRYLPTLLFLPVQQVCMALWVRG